MTFRYTRMYMYAHEGLACFARRIIPLGVREISSPSRSDLRWFSRQVSNLPWRPDPLRPQHDCSRAGREGRSASSSTSLFVSASIFIHIAALLQCSVSRYNLNLSRHFVIIIAFLRKQFHFITLNNHIIMIISMLFYENVRNIT